MMEKLKNKIFRVINHKRRTAHVTDTKVHSNLRSIYSKQDKNHSSFWILEPSKKWLVIKEHVTNIYIYIYCVYHRVLH